MLNEWSGNVIGYLYRITFYLSFKEKITKKILNRTPTIFFDDVTKNRGFKVPKNKFSEYTTLTQIRVKRYLRNREIAQNIERNRCQGLKHFFRDIQYEEEEQLI